MESLRNLAEAPYKSENNKFMFSLIVVLILILIGVVAFGWGGHIIAHKGIGAGAWGAVHIGMPNKKEGLLKIGKGQHGYDQMREGYDINRYNTSPISVGVLDTPATMQIPGQTIMGYEEKKIFGLPQGGSLYNL